MAEQIFKELKTKIALKYIDFATWSTEAFKAEKPLKGEVWFCEIPQGNATATTAPTVLFKVGDGVNTFGALNWCSALAADVHAWAKKSQDEFITWVNTVVEHPAAPVITTGSANGTIAVDGTDVAVKGLGSAAYTDANAYATAEQGGKADAAAAAIATYGDIVTHNAAEFAPADIDTGIHAVDLVTGANNGTVKLTVDGADKEVAVAGLKDAAYVTVESLNKTAKDYADAVEAKIPTELGVMSVAAGDDTITIGGDGKAVTVKVTENKFDAHGAAAAVLGESTDTAAANTVYGAKAAAAAAQGTANEAKTKIDTFLGTVTPDGSKDIIDTLQEINNYVGEHGQEFAALSGKVTNIENGTTVVPKASDADTLDGKQAADFADATENGAKALAQGVKDVVDANKATWDKAGTALQAADLADYAKTTDVVTNEEFTTFEATNTEAINNAKKAGEDAAANVKTGVENGTIVAAKATDADKLGGVEAANYALKSDIPTDHLTEVVANNTDDKHSGIKVTDKNKIEIDDEVIFVLNANF